MRIGPWPASLGLMSLLALLTLAPAMAAGSRPDNDPGRLPVKAFPGARIVNRSSHGLEDYWIALGKLLGDGQADRNETVQGKLTHVAFANAEGRSVTEVFTYYQQQLSKAGFEVVYACKGLECGEGGRKTNGDWWALSENRRYVAARLPRARGDLWVTVHVHARKPNAPVEHEVDVVEARAPSEPVRPRDEADVATLQKELKANGRVVLHSLEFAEGRPALLPESEGVVQAIAELLARDPSLKLHIVVHTDDAAAAGASLELTRKRASVLVNLLKQKHRVPSARIQPAGLGMLAPVASNGTEEGRSLNRRVELVPQGPGRGREAAATVEGGR